MLVLSAFVSSGSHLEADAYSLMSQENARLRAKLNAIQVSKILQPIWYIRVFFRALKWGSVPRIQIAVLGFERGSVTLAMM